jgi:Flp pilus assembly protein TadB
MVLLDLLLFAIYFSPSIVGTLREHPKGGTLFLINLCLGWTVIGWIFCLIWAWTEGKPFKE